MKAKPVVLHVVLAAVVIGALLAGLAVQAAWPERRWMNIQLHSAMEALGGLAAIVMAFVLLQRREEPGGDTFSRLALGFLGMGLLEEFHTVSPLGNGTVLLRSVASLVGGIGFALVWLPDANQKLTWQVQKPVPGSIDPVRVNLLSSPSVGALNNVVLCKLLQTWLAANPTVGPPKRPSRLLCWWWTWATSAIGRIQPKLANHV